MSKTANLRSLRSYRDASPCRGLTLLELVMVLVILAILATVAVQMIEPQVDQARYEATITTLENVKAGVLGDHDSRQSDGTPVVNGFVADMGRLPKDSGDIPGRELSELWEQGTLPTSARRTINASHSSGESDAVGMTLLVGYRGPYIALPLDSHQLLDGWGNAFVTQFDGGTNQLTSIQSGGGGVSPYDTPIPNEPLSFAADVYSVEELSIRVEDSQGNPESDVTVFLVEPHIDPSDPNNETDEFLKLTKKTTDPSGLCTFENLTIGTRSIRVIQGGTNGRVRDVPVVVYPRLNSIRVVLP